MMVSELINYAKEQYGTSPDYPWDKTPEFAVLRHSENRKWYALFMEVKKSVFGLGDGKVWIANIKCNSYERECLIAEGKAFPAYHMNKRLWTSVLIDGSVDIDSLKNLIDQSYDITR
ncbi:MAG: MmcQ/YjbR family DNA-binding protein [Ruminococcus sp.]|nr:MmcQ/YjbR family DNA-binding protein [Ruminococcus sp.]